VKQYFVISVPNNDGWHAVPVGSRHCETWRHHLGDPWPSGQAAKRLTATALPPGLAASVVCVLGTSRFLR
jgi:hypothetical protein